MKPVVVGRHRLLILASAAIAASGSIWACSSPAGTGAAGDGGADGSLPEGAASDDGATPDATSTTEGGLPEGSVDSATTDSGMVADSGQRTEAGMEAGVDAATDSATDAVADGATDSAAASDGSEAGVVDLVLATGVDNSNNAMGAVYAAGAWTSTAIGTDLYDPQGGGVVVTAGRRGIITFRGNANAVVESSVWNGSWPMLASEGTSTNAVSAPVAGGAGAFIAYQQGPVGFAQYDETAASWASQATGASSDNNSVPGVVTTQSGDPMIVFTDASSQSYSYSLRTSGTWSAAATVTGSSAPSLAGTPAIIAVRIAATGSLVAAMAGANSGEIDTAVYASGAWTTTKNVATDAAFSQGRPFSLAALPDGRVALAYVDSGQAMHLAFYAGSAWGSFSTVPGTGDKFPRFPISIARGANGTAVLELVYLDGTGDSRTPQHVRLTSEAPMVWTSPAAVATGSYDSAYIAVGP